MKKDKNEILKAFGDLLDVVEELRQKCPWDRKQTNESLRCNTIEEVYELSAALMADDADNIRKELGDVLLHVLFYSIIGKEKNQFDIADVVGIIGHQSRAQLIEFFYRIASQTLVGLFSIPRTLLTQFFHHVQQVAKSLQYLVLIFLHFLRYI
jgi:NTP pyrophosphatase (non-canonical NTP hydrolase)